MADAVLELPPTRRKRLGSVMITKGCPSGSLTFSGHLSTPVLPQEILSMIFLISVHDIDDPHEAISTSFTLSHVCARWRHVAIFSRGLWTKILLTFPISRGQLSLAALLLKRSGSHSLDILLDLRDPSWDWELAESEHGLHWTDVDLIFRLLLPHVRRWRNFELLSDTWMPIFAFLCHTRRVDQAPKLETLSLSRCNAYFASKDAVFFPVEMGRPIALFGGCLGFDKLREVGLIGIHLDWARSSLRNLTSLELKYLASDVAPSISEFIDILCASPDLQRLVIVGRGPKFEANASAGGTAPTPSQQEERQKVILRHLTDFTFGFMDVEYALRLLPLFSFPALEELSLEGFSMDHDVSERSSLDSTPLFEWLAITQSTTHRTDARAPPAPPPPFPLHSIRTLSLDGIYASKSTFSQFFNDLTGLERLRLSNSDNNAFYALAPPVDGSLIFPCPGLQELECGGVHSEALVNAVRARAWLNTGEKSLKKSTVGRSGESARLVTAP